MKQIVHKGFWDYEKEEKWLNEMSARGLAMTDCAWFRYSFEETLKNEYIYRIELLDNMPNHPESMSYIRFLEESGVECISSYDRWIYLRKKSSEGPFDIYTDIHSKLMHYKRIKYIWGSLMWVEFSVAAVFIIMASIGIISSRKFDIPTNYFAVGGLNLLAGLLFFKLGLPIRKKIRRLKKEKVFTE